MLRVLYMQTNRIILGDTQSVKGVGNRDANIARALVSGSLPFDCITPRSIRVRVYVYRVANFNVEGDYRNGLLMVHICKIRFLKMPQACT